MDEQPYSNYENDSAMINEIISRAQEIEERLQELSDEELDELCALIEAVADELPEEVKEKLTFHFVKRLEEAEAIAFEGR